LNPPPLLVVTLLVQAWRCVAWEGANPYKGGGGGVIPARVGRGAAPRSIRLLEAGGAWPPLPPKKGGGRVRKIKISAIGVGGD
jgi:hypothetical protein